MDVILNLVDASHIRQGLELTLELLELGKPLVVGLNMMDEAARMGFDGIELLVKVDRISRGRFVLTLFNFQHFSIVGHKVEAFK